MPPFYCTIFHLYERCVRRHYKATYLLGHQLDCASVTQKNEGLKRFVGGLEVVASEEEAYVEADTLLRGFKDGAIRGTKSAKEVRPRCSALGVCTWGLGTLAYAPDGQPSGLLEFMVVSPVK